jgi:hypothetical protein
MANRTHKKRPRDPSQLGKMIVDISVGDVEDRVPTPEEERKNPAAVSASHTNGNAGHDAQVLIQGANNQFRAEWTYGHDPYPPPG